MIISFAALALIHSFASIAPVPQPTELPAKTGCLDWQGTASGNDPSVVVRLQVCGDGTQVRGTFQWSSQRSGWNRRSVEGTRGTAGFTLRDTALIEDRPADGWRFCLIDSYQLTASGDELVGTYDSAACADHATLTLRRTR